ncbi:hypothetical protein FQN54_003200 [Arachnomyces sp. PD_36]|nr:hypothetical protein FQN54_003200 [Arachnomyces sp. PD_36]
MDPTDPDFEYGIQSQVFESADSNSKAFPRETPDRGHGLFTRMRIGLGEDVFQIRKPTVAVLDTARLEDTCAHCFGEGTAYASTEEKVKLKRCTGCQMVRYCDRTCQSKSWSFAHKYECPIFKKLPLSSLPINARAILQIALRFKHRKMNQGQIDNIFALTYNPNFKSVPERYKNIANASKTVWEHGQPSFTNEDVEIMFAILDNNCFTLTTPSSDRIGLVMDSLFASYMNHSCEYNTVVVFDGKTIYAKAIRPIDREEILISYIDATNPFEQRQLELQQRYNFTCECPKCNKGIETREDRFLKPVPSNSRELLDAKSEIKRIMAHMENKSPLAKVEGYKSGMRLLRGVSIWPITRQPYATLRDELIASLLEAQQFQAAFAQATVRYLWIDPFLWREDYHPTRHMHDWVLAKLAIYISQGAEITHDTMDLRPYEIDFGLLVWMLLNKLSGKSGICSVPSFQAMIESRYEEVCQEFAAHGLKPASMQEEMKRQWVKLNKLADDVLLKDE